MSLDLLAFGPHPDDIEIGMGGTVALHVALGFRVGLCDLTRGELSSNGTPDGRVAEAEAARAVLGALVRVNLELPDGGLSAEDPAQIDAVVACIRSYRPRTVAIPFRDDRHPDHGEAHQLLRSAIFKSGLRRYAMSGSSSLAAWRPDWVCHYFINDAATPSFLIDVTSVYEVKRRALACHSSQFAPAEPGSTGTRLTSPRFAQLIESRDAQFGALAGVSFAEGFVASTPVVRPHLLQAWGSPVSAEPDNPGPTPTGSATTEARRADEASYGS
jgi:bacillithiol biosynthesis deacetylase BshB1